MYSTKNSLTGVIGLLMHTMVSCLFHSFAKVEGPLFSLGARGKIANAMVFFPWKGRHVVRQWLIPTNPQSTNQGYIRAALKAISKFISKIQCVSKGSALDSLLYQAATDQVESGLNWNAWLAAGYLDLLQSANTFNTAQYTGIIDEYSNSISASVQTAFETLAGTLGLTGFSFGYGYTTEIPAGLQLYFGAKACYEKSVSNASPWTVDPVSWDVADVTTLEQAMTTNA